MYNDKVLDHFQNPRNTGEIPDADGVGEVGSAECGDIMVMYIKVDNDRLTDVKFRTFGCAAAIASSSIATEMIKGKTIDEALRLTRTDVSGALGGLPDHKMHCSNLAPDALRAAIEDYRAKSAKKT